MSDPIAPVLPVSPQAPRGMVPAVVTIRPDNILTVGLIGGIVYFGAVALAQVAMRAGWIKAAPKPSTAPVPAGAALV